VHEDFGKKNRRKLKEEKMGAGIPGKRGRL
jgi:hypothetical protein